MNPNNTHDMETKLNAIKHIQPQESLSNKSDELFEKFWLEHQEKFAYRQHSRWAGVQSLFAFILAPVFWATKTRYRQATAVCTVLIAVIFFALSSVPPKSVLAATLKALESVQSMKFSLNITTDGEVTESGSIVWESPNRVRADQIGEQQTIAKTWVLDGTEFAEIDHTKQTVLQGDVSQPNSIYAADYSSWVSSSTAPINLVVQSMDYVHRNWENVSVREDLVDTPNHIKTYLFEYENGRSIELIIDANTELPLSMHSVYPANETHGLIHKTYQFEWNSPIDDSLFAPEIPENYSIQTLEVPDHNRLPGINNLGQFRYWPVRFDMNPPSDPPAAVASVVGTVVDLDGNPVPDASVGTYFDSKFQPKTMSDALGNFRFELPIPESNTSRMNWKLIQCLADGYSIDAYEVMLDQYSTSAKVQFVLSPGSSLHGKVVDENDEPIAGALVETRHSYNRYRDLSFFPIRTKTNENGEFTLTGLDLDQDEFEVEVEKEGFLKQTAQAKRVGYGEPCFELENGSIGLSKGNARIIQVVDADGNPVEGADIQVDTYFDANWGLNRSGKTDSFGSVEISGFSKRYYDAIVWKKGYGYEIVEIDFNEGGPLYVTLQPGIRMQGKVVDNEGNPVKGIGVMIGEEEFKHSWQILNRIKSERTDENGLFEITGLKPNTPMLVRTVVPHDLPYLPQERNITVEDISPYQNEPLILTVDQVQTLEGNVVYEETGEPVPFFNIWFMREEVDRLNRRTYLKDITPLLIYNSSSGYFKERLITAPNEDYEDEITVKVKVIDNPNAKDHREIRKTFSLDELKDGRITIEVPKQ